MSFRVFRVIKIAGFSNSHAVNRSEEWSILLHHTFNTQESAKECIRSNHANLPEFINLAQGLSKEARKQFLDEFSFLNDLYIFKRTHFLAADVKSLRKLLVKDLHDNGIVVKNDNASSL